MEHLTDLSLATALIITRPQPLASHSRATKAEPREGVDCSVDCRGANCNGGHVQLQAAVHGRINGQ